MVKMPVVEPKSGGLDGNKRSCVDNSRIWHLKDIPLIGRCLLNISSMFSSLNSFYF